MANRVQAALYALREGISSPEEEVAHDPGKYPLNNCSSEPSFH